MTREELKVHCEKQIENCEMWAKHKGEEPHGKVYEEHKLILELLEQETVSKEVYDHEYFLRKEFELKIDKLQRQLEKIRTEIEQTTSRYCISRERGGSGQVEWSDRLIKESEVLEIIDKAESENEDGEN